MKQIRSVEWVGISAGILASSLLGVGLAFAEPQQWNQKEVTRLASEFASSIEKISNTAKSAPLQKSAIQQRKRDGAVNRLGGLQESADAFAKQLAEGRDRSSTELFFPQVRELFHQTIAVARDAEAGEEQRANLEAAEKLLDQLARYYSY